MERLSPDVVTVHHTLGPLAREFGVRSTTPPDVADRDPRRQLGFALERLYAALNGLHGGEPIPFLEVWSHTDDTTLVTPAGGMVAGWDHVRTELDRDARDLLGSQVVAEDVQITLGIEIAWAICAERLTKTSPDVQSAAESRQHSTNIFRRESGVWRLVHRQISPIRPADPMAGRSASLATAMSP